MKKLLSFLIIICLSIFFLEAKAATKTFYNITTRVGEDMATQVNINYHTDVLDTFVEYTLATDTTYSNATRVSGTYERFTAPEGATVNGFGDRYRVKVSLNNLTPGTKYMYRVGVTGDFSENYYFTTAKEGTFSFLHITDPQYGNETNAAIFNTLMTKALEKNPDIAFTFFTGDIIDRGGNEAQWDMFYKQSNTKKMSLATVPGNHEYYDYSGPPAYFGEFFDLHNNNPDNGPQGAKNTAYYFRYYNTLFIALNSELKEHTYQKKWFEEVMIKNHDAKYVIVGMHRSMYGSIYASDSVAVRNNYLELFDKYGVDLVLSGHDHIYSRSYRLYNNGKSNDPAKGTVYIIGGAGGAKFYSNSPTNENNVYYNKVIENTSVANIITISDEGITTELINKEGKTVDKFTDNNGNESMLKSKRNGTVDVNFSKAEFVNQIVFEKSKNDSSAGYISWPKSAYGNVIHVRVDNADLNYPIKSLFMYNQNLNTFTFGGLYPNKVNKFKVFVTYADLSVDELEYEISTIVPPKPVYLSISQLLEQCKGRLDKAITDVYKIDE